MIRNSILNKKDLYMGCLKTDSDRTADVSQ